MENLFPTSSLIRIGLPRLEYIRAYYGASISDLTVNQNSIKPTTTIPFKNSYLRGNAVIYVDSRMSASTIKSDSHPTHNFISDEGYPVEDLKQIVLKDYAGELLAFYSESRTKDVSPYYAKTFQPSQDDVYQSILIMQNVQSRENVLLGVLRHRLPRRRGTIRIRRLEDILKPQPQPGYSI